MCFVSAIIGKVVRPNIIYVHMCTSAGLLAIHHIDQIPRISFKSTLYWTICAHCHNLASLGTRNQTPHASRTQRKVWTFHTSCLCLCDSSSLDSPSDKSLLIQDETKHHPLRSNPRYPLYLEVHLPYLSFDSSFYIQFLLLIFFLLWVPAICTYFFVCCFMRQGLSLANGGLKFLILLLQPFEFCNYRHTSHSSILSWEKFWWFYLISICFIFVLCVCVPEFMYVLH